MSKILAAATIAASLVTAEVVPTKAEELQNYYKSEIAKNLSISSISNLKLLMSLTSNDSNTTSGEDEGTDNGYEYLVGGERISGTLVAGPAMLKEQHCDDCEVPHSKIGLDYVEITKGDKQLAEMLAEGEKEFFGNIDKVVEYKGGRKRYKRKSRQEGVWEEIVKTIGKGEMDKRQLNTLEVGTPNMLLSFVKINNKNFSLLKEIGKLEVEEGKLEVEEGKLEVEEGKLEVEEGKLEVEEGKLEKEKEETRKLKQLFGKL